MNLDAPKLHEQLTQAMDYLKQADTGECKVNDILITCKNCASSIVRYLKLKKFCISIK